MTGTGEASPVGISTTKEIWKISAELENLAPKLPGCDVGAAEEILKYLDISPPLRFGLETAMMDILGQVKGRPVATLLGGRPLSLAVNALINTRSPWHAANEARNAIKMGFTCLKLKLGRGNLDDDAALVSAVRHEAGPGIKLRIDANQAWDVRGAIVELNTLSRYNIEYVEQPVLATDIAGMAKVRSSVSVPIAADESLSSLEDLQRLLSAGAADVFVIKAARLGGIKCGLEIANRAIKEGRGVVVTTSFESSVGIAASAHLASALPSSDLAHGLATSLLFSEDLINPPLTPVSGKLTTPSSPGLGVKVNIPLLEKRRSNIMGWAGSLFEIW